MKIHRIIEDSLTKALNIAGLHCIVQCQTTHDPEKSVVWIVKEDDPEITLGGPYILSPYQIEEVSVDGEPVYRISQRVFSQLTGE